MLVIGRSWKRVKRASRSAPLHHLAQASQRKKCEAACSALLPAPHRYMHVKNAAAPPTPHHRYMQAKNTELLTYSYMLLFTHPPTPHHRYMHVKNAKLHEHSSSNSSQVHASDECRAAYILSSMLLHYPPPTPHQRYMQVKNAKLQEQFEASSFQTAPKSNLFCGVSIFVNGYTQPTHAELRQIMIMHGGRFEVGSLVPRLV